MNNMQTYRWKELSPAKSLGLFVVLLIVMEMVIYRDYVFGKYLMLFRDLGDDSYVSHYPNFVARMRSLMAGEIPQWSFHLGMGENMYPFWFEPVSVGIIYTFFREDVAAGIVWVLLAHTFLSGVLFYAFLRTLRFHGLVCTVGGLLYAFSSYMVLYGSWVLNEYSATVTQMAFLLLAIEQYISHKRWYLYPLAVGLIAMHQPFNVYFAGILTLIYLGIRYHSVYGGQLRAWARDLWALVGMGLLGLGLSAVMLLSVLYQMSMSPRGSGEASKSSQLLKSPVRLAEGQELKSAFLRMFSTNLEGSAMDFTGWYNYFESPLLYCGLLVLLLVPQLFHYISNRERKVFGGVLVGLAFIFLIPFLRHAFWLFTGNYYRFLSLLFVLVMLLFAMSALDHIAKGGAVHRKTLLITLGVLTLPLIAMSGSLNNPAPSLILVLMFLGLYTWGLYSLHKIPSGYPHGLLLLGLLCLELTAFHTPALTERRIFTRNALTSTKGLNDGTKEIVENLRKQDNSFFRVEKDFFSGLSQNYSLNEAKIQGFYGTRSYNSFNNVHYVTFLKSIGEIREKGETATRFVKGIALSPLAMKLCGVKYFLSKGTDVSAYQKKDMELLHTSGPIHVYRVNRAMPLGVTYNTYILDSDYARMSHVARQSCLLKAVVIDKDMLEDARIMYRVRYISDSKAVNRDSLDDWTNKLREDTMSIQSFTANQIKGKISLDQQKVLFLAIPYHKGWHALVNGRERPMFKVFNGLMGLPLDRGTYDIELKFEDPYRFKGTLISLASFLLLVGMIVYIKLKKG